MTRVGVYGGGFDPIHLGHVALAVAAVDQFTLDPLYVIPTFHPPHKAMPYAPFADRLAMARLAFDGRSSIIVSDIERRRGGASYAVDTVAAIARLHPEAELYYLVGADTAAEIPTWKAPDRLAEQVCFLVAERPGFQGEFAPGYRHENIRMAPHDISATKVRALIGAGQPFAEVVPPAVASYIREHRLYQNDA